MSGTGTSKRSLEDSSHGHFPSTAKFPSHEDHTNNSGSANPGTSPAFSNLPSSSTPLATSSDYHATGPAPFESGPDAPRLPKIPRTDSQQQLQRPSPHISMSRIPSSSPGDLLLDLPSVAPENRVELRDPSKGGGRDLKTVESNRDVKSDSREFHFEGKRDSQTALKTEKDVGRFEISRALGDVNKETKYDTEIHTADSKGEVNVASSHSSWKEIKELHRGKRYLESSPSRVVGTMEWHMARRREATDVKPWAYLDSQSHEAVGENKVDSKSDEKFKDKDRKRKDGKPRDWGERDKERSDRRLQLGTSGNEGRDLMREEKESERWDRERKESMKEKERSKEQKDHAHVKREAWNGAEPDSAQHHEKEVTASSIRKTEQQENLGIEQKKQKDFDFDSWKSADREARERRKERDGDVEGDRPERRSRIYEKESDDGCTDVDGGNERERDVFNYGVQQRKRMLRPRCSPQMSNREPRFRSRSQDVDGSHGKPEISTIVYKVGECMQELTKLWSEYESSQADKNGESSHILPTLEIRIPAEHVTATNRQVRGAQLWGTDTYTVDSDLVAVLMHTGYCRPTASPPAPAIHELHATIRVLPPQDCYVSTLRNNVRSRAWGAATSCSFRIERCCIVKKGGGTIDLEPCLTYTSTVEPTLAPVAVERTMTTRAAASNALRQQRFVREVTIQYNLCNEPWIKYSISIVADKGLKRPLYTSARLKKGEVLYLETHFHRYELSFTGERMVRAANAAQIHEPELEKSHNHNLHSANGERNLDADNTVIDVFRWSRCKKLLPQKIMCSVGIPLPLEYLEVLEENLDWEDVQWSQTGVWIAGKEYALARVHFLSPA